MQEQPVGRRGAARDARGGIEVAVGEIDVQPAVAVGVEKRRASRDRLGQMKLARPAVDVLEIDSTL